MLAPLLLGAAGLGYLSSTGGGAAGAVGAGGLTAAKAWVATHASLAAVGGVALTATAVVAVYAASHLGGHTATPQGSPPVHSAPAVPGTSTHSHGPGHAGKTHGRTATDPGRPPAPPSARRRPSRRRASSAPTGSPTAPALSGAPAGPDRTGNRRHRQPDLHRPDDPDRRPDPRAAPPTRRPGRPTRRTSLSFTSTPPVRPTFGSTYELRASAAGRGITFSVDAATTHQACALSGATTVVFDHAGTCVIAADVSAKAGHPVTQSIDVPQADQTVRDLLGRAGRTPWSPARPTPSPPGRGQRQPGDLHRERRLHGVGRRRDASSTPTRARSPRTGRQHRLHRRHGHPDVPGRPGSQTIVFTSTPPASARVGDTYTGRARPARPARTSPSRRRAPRARSPAPPCRSRHRRLRDRRRPGRQRPTTPRRPGSPRPSPCPTRSTP